MMANNQITISTHHPIDMGAMASINLAREAIQSKKCLSIQYGGYDRVVEVHALGITKDGNPIVKAWQLSGGSNGNGPSAWKHFRLDRASHISLLDQESDAPREGYAPNDRAIDLILTQV